MHQSALLQIMKSEGFLTTISLRKLMVVGGRKTGVSLAILLRIHYQWVLSWTVMVDLKDQECEASWFLYEDIGVRAFFDYGTYMESLGLKPLWSELKIIPE